MKLQTTRESLIGPLQRVIGAVERKQIRPILSHVLLRPGGDGVELLTTDLEIGLLAVARAEVTEPSACTLPARKLLDIVKALPAGSEIHLTADAEKGHVRAGRSRFDLMALPAEGFPEQEALEGAECVELPAAALADLLDRTAFAMAVEDVRYYLNGLLLEFRPGEVRAVATDGHRMALAQTALDSGLSEVRQVLIPRKGVQELVRLAAGGQGMAQMELAKNQVRVTLVLGTDPAQEEGPAGDVVRFSSKLIDAQYPDYERVVPTDLDKTLLLDRRDFLEALQRVSILANERLRGVRLGLEKDRLVLQAQNQEQEQAEEVLDVEYGGPEMVIGFNVVYLVEALQALRSDVARLGLSDPAGSTLIDAPGDSGARYVVMPMRL
jgi:DNA polymerase-3 subunit beta